MTFLFCFPNDLSCMESNLQRTQKNTQIIIGIFILAYTIVFTSCFFDNTKEDTFKIIQSNMIELNIIYYFFSIYYISCHYYRIHTINKQLNNNLKLFFKIYINYWFYFLYIAWIGLTIYMILFHFTYIIVLPEPDNMKASLVIFLHLLNTAYSVLQLFFDICCNYRPRQTNEIPYQRS